MATPLPEDETVTPPRLPNERRRSRPRLVPGGRVSKLARSSPPLSVWSVILGSRMLLFLVGYLTVTHVPGAAINARLLTYNRDQLLPGTLGTVLNSWANWDGQWYVRIARVGYHRLDYTAFFPLYPLLVRWLTPLAAHSYIIAGVALSSAFYLAAMYMLYRLVAIDYERRVAAWTVIFASLFPTSFFFQAVYTESAFLFFVVACLFWARREQWLLAGCAGFLAALTRNTGILVLLPMSVFYMDARHWRLGRVDRHAAWFALVPAGLAVWMAYLQVRLGDWLAFSRAQRHWDRSFALPWVTLSRGLRSGASGIATLLLHHGQPAAFAAAGGTLQVSSHYARVALPNALALVTLVVAVGALVLAARRLRLAYLVYGFAALVAPLSYPTPLQPLYSMPRFILAVFPVFLALALLTERLRATRLALLAASALTLVLLTSVFVRFIFVA